MVTTEIPNWNIHRLRAQALCAVACLGWLASAPPVLAGSVSGAMEVRLDLVPSCSFITRNMDDALLDFGRTAGMSDEQQTDGQANPTRSLAVISIACSNSYTGANAPVLTVSDGLHSEGSQRYLLGPEQERIAYDLYADAARHIPLDPTAPMQLVIPAAGVITAIPIYGRIPHVEDPLAGLYTDVVWLTLSY